MTRVAFTVGDRVAEVGVEGVEGAGGENCEKIFGEGARGEVEGEGGDRREAGCIFKRATRGW